MLGVCAAALAGAVTMAAGVVPPDTAIAFPADYRSWTHVKTTLVGAQHPSFASNGGYDSAVCESIGAGSTQRRLIS